MDLMTFVVLGLACWRLSSLLVDESGPFEVFDWLRAWAGVAYDAQNRRRPLEEQGGLAQVFCCIWCMSVWVGLALAAGWWFWPQGMGLVCLPLALSAAAIWVSRTR